jgi:enoyl-CoA hydratase
MTKASRAKGVPVPKNAAKIGRGDTDPGPGESRSLVLSRRSGPVAVLTLNHPPVNVLTGQLLEELADRVLEAAADPSVRVLVIASAMKGFSGGADINAMVKMDRAEASAFSSKGQAVANLLERIPLPVIVAVNGFCFGGGSELSQACDFIVASEDAMFGQPEILIGVIPGWGGSQRLSRLVGAARARRWIMTGEKVPARTAAEWGLVDQVVPPERLMEAAMSVANELATKPAIALAAAKYAINQATDPARLLGLDFERELWGLLFERADQREGMSAFLQKRPADFSDRREREPREPLFPWQRPGNSLEHAREQVYRPSQDITPGPTFGWETGRSDMPSPAEAYRDAGNRALEAFFDWLGTATEAYRSWLRLALHDPGSPYRVHEPASLDPPPPTLSRAGSAPLPRGESRHRQLPLTELMYPAKQ